MTANEIFQCQILTVKIVLAKEIQPTLIFEISLISRLFLFSISLWIYSVWTSITSVFPVVVGSWKFINRSSWDRNASIEKQRIKKINMKQRFIFDFGDILSEIFLKDPDTQESFKISHWTSSYVSCPSWNWHFISG